MDKQQSEPSVKQEQTKYILEMTEAQARNLVRALDLYSRIGMGQLEAVDQEVRMWSDESLSSHEEREESIKSLKTALFGFARGHRAIMSERVHDQYRLAWDTMKVVRYAVAWHTRPMGGATVDFATPMKYGSEPLPKCTVKKGSDEQNL